MVFGYLVGLCYLVGMWGKSSENHRNCTGKAKGNAHFHARELEEAFDAYTEAIVAMETSASEIDIEPVRYTHPAAYLMRLSNPQQCLVDCDRPLSFKMPYPRVRCCCKTMAELKKVIEDGHAMANSHPREMREINAEADQETDQMKTEALSQLNDLGNKYLGLFDLNIDNFQTQQDPDGGYNIQFKK
jgi:valyl-tRNA synthetase